MCMKSIKSNTIQNILHMSYNSLKQTDEPNNSLKADNK